MNVGDAMKNAKAATLILFAILLMISSILIQSRISVLHEEEVVQVTGKHLELSYDLNNFISENVALVKGVSAYLQMNEVYVDNEVYALLNHLYKDNLNEVRNITIIENTTIVWVYPLVGNESAVGVDLSKIPAQALQIEHLKETLDIMFVGPVDLVQGGQGFIVRVPIMKDNAFWGMTSIVLKAEEAFRFIEEHADKHDVRYFITEKNNRDNIIYGEQSVLDESPIQFESKSTFGTWDIYVVPSNGWNDQNLEIIALIFVALFFSAYISNDVYKRLTEYLIVVDRKKQLEHESSIDRLTGITNRYAFDTTINSHILRSEQTHYLEPSPSSLIYFDIDNFKKVNDTLGHSTGDYVLMTVSSLISSIVRDSDTFARWGGDEFIVLLENTSLHQAENVAQKIQSTLELYNFEYDLSITVSIGITERKPHEPWKQWFERTDSVLYQSKTKGRNCITLSD